jgi:hypothetical protein
LGREEDSAGMVKTILIYTIGYAYYSDHNVTILSGRGEIGFLNDTVRYNPPRIVVLWLPVRYSIWDQGLREARPGDKMSKTSVFQEGRHVQPHLSECNSLFGTVLNYGTVSSTINSTLY